MEQGSAIFLFKPDAENHRIRGKERDYSLREVAIGMLVSAGVVIVGEASVKLEPTDVRSMYANALKPNPVEDAKYGTQWKDDVVDHLISGPVDALLLDDVDGWAEYKAKLVKSHLRSVLSGPDNVVQNIAHVPDEDEFSMTRSILFSHE